MPYFKIKVIIFIVIAKPKNTKSTGKALQFNLLFVSKDIDIDKKLYKEAIIKINKKTFNLITAANNYIKTFTFEKDYFLIQIKIIENCKIKIAKKSTVYTKLAIKFFENRLQRENKQMLEQFIKLIELFLTIKLIIANIKV